jgi:hypothetical protein
VTREGRAPAPTQADVDAEPDFKCQDCIDWSRAFSVCAHARARVHTGSDASFFSPGEHARGAARQSRHSRSCSAACSSSAAAQARPPAQDGPAGRRRRRRRRRLQQVASRRRRSVCRSAAFLWRRTRWAIVAALGFHRFEALVLDGFAAVSSPAPPARRCACNKRAAGSSASSTSSNATRSRSCAAAAARVPVRRARHRGRMRRTYGDDARSNCTTERTRKGCITRQ